MPIKIKDNISDQEFSEKAVESGNGDLSWEDVTEVVSDPEPEHTTNRGKKARRTPPRTRTTARPVAQATKRDIQAKVSMILLPAGAVWQTRDAECGSAFVNNTPDIAEALTDIIVDSPDLVKWFTGTGGSFMKYFKLLMALQPVAMTVVQHHVMHNTKPNGDVSNATVENANADWTGYDIPSA